MATFVLIHGAWHGGWCFDAVKILLETQGHHIIAPDLPGMGGDEAILRSESLVKWAEFAADLCRSAPSRPVILAGHSRGGIVISQAAELAPDAVDAVVYICAMMLPDGMSRVQFKALEEPNPAFDAIKRPVFDGAGSVIDANKAGGIFAQLSPRVSVEAAMKRLVAEPSAPAATPLSLSSKRFGRVPRTYIACLYDRTIPISSQRLMQALVPGARVVTLQADHSPFLSRPAELTAALIEAIPL